MNLLVVFPVVLVTTILLCPVTSIQIGKIENAMLSTNNTPISIPTDGSYTDCLCQALSASSTVVAINYFFNQPDLRTFREL